MISADNIVTIIAADRNPVTKIGSIIECKYCERFAVYQPERDDPYLVDNHYVYCVWELSRALVRLDHNIKS